MVCVCACVYVCTYLWVLESYYGMANYVHFIHFQCLFTYFSAILSHSPSCIVRAGFCNRWDLGQACSLVMPCQTWDSPARQVVPKTCNVHRKGSASVLGQQPEIGKTLRWPRSFQFLRNFHQPQERGTFLKIKMESRLCWGCSSIP